MFKRECIGSAPDLCLVHVAKVCYTTKAHMQIDPSRFWKNQHIYVMCCIIVVWCVVLSQNKMLPVTFSVLIWLANILCQIDAWTKLWLATCFCLLFGSKSEHLKNMSVLLDVEFLFSLFRLVGESLPHAMSIFHAAKSFSDIYSSRPETDANFCR